MVGLVQQGFPNISSQLVNSNGFIQQAWFQLLVALWNRTGGPQGTQTFTTGDLKITASMDVEEGWLVCDGSAVGRSKYPSLFTKIGTTWGVGDGSTTFNIPDFRDRFPRGLGSDSIGTEGGSDSITLTIDNLPSHNHPVIDPGHIHTVTDPGHTHIVNDPGHAHDYSTYLADAVADIGVNSVADNSVGETTSSSVTGISINSHLTNVTVDNNTTGITTGNVGGGTEFSILPPYGVVNYMIKT